jgi:phosphoserine aminotransferase
MNVTWVIDEVDGDEGSSREQRFLKGAEAQGFRQIKGHRSVGGGSIADKTLDRQGV